MRGDAVTYFWTIGLFAWLYVACFWAWWFFKQFAKPNTELLTDLRPMTNGERIQVWRKKRRARAQQFIKVRL